MTDAMWRCAQMLVTIVNIQPKDTGGGGGDTREMIVYRLADEMLDKLPSDYVPHEVQSPRYSLYM